MGDRHYAAGSPALSPACPAAAQVDQMSELAGRRRATGPAPISARRIFASAGRAASRIVYWPVVSRRFGTRCGGASFTGHRRWPRRVWCRRRRRQRCRHRWAGGRNSFTGALTSFMSVGYPPSSSRRVVCMYVCISSKIRPQCGFSGFASIQGTGLMKRRVKQTHMLKEMNDECLNNARS